MSAFGASGRGAGSYGGADRTAAAGRGVVVPWLNEPPDTNRRCDVAPVIGGVAHAHAVMQAHLGHGAARCRQVRAAVEWLREAGLMVPDYTGWWRTH